MAKWDCICGHALEDHTQDADCHCYTACKLCPCKQHDVNFKCKCGHDLVNHMENFEVVVCKVCQCPFLKEAMEKLRRLI